MNRFLGEWLNEHGIYPAAVYGVHNAGAAGEQALHGRLLDDNSRRP